MRDFTGSERFVAQYDGHVFVRMRRTFGARMRIRLRMATPFAGKRALVTGAGKGQARVLLA